jgi:hypothetical protein
MISNTAHATVEGKDFALRVPTAKSIRTPVVFICNHCPYLKASINRIAAEANALRRIGIGAIAITPEARDCWRLRLRRRSREECQENSWRR